MQSNEKLRHYISESNFIDENFVTIRYKTFTWRIGMNVKQIETCITEYGDDIYRFCYYLTQSKDLADDLYQDCFLAALEKEITVDEKKTKNFLMGIAANQWKNQWRKNKRRQKLMVQVEYKEEYMSEHEYKEVVGANDPLSALIESETEKLVLEAVNSLPEEYRIVVLMYYGADMSTKEISSELHMSKGSVTSKLMRARKKIKKGLEANGYER